MEVRYSMNEELLITEESIFQVPLLVPMAAKYFEKIGNKNNDEYYRSVDVRLCLEKICDNYIYEFIDDTDKEKWNKKGMVLHNKLQVAKKYLDSDIVDALIAAKDIGNKGAHEGEEASFCEMDFEVAQRAIFNFSLEVLVFYFKKYGYAKMNKEGSWVPYIFSTLPPLYRVKVLRRYFETNPEHIVIEKLAMAYTKARMNKEMVEFLDLCLDVGHINKYQYDSLIEEMKQIEECLDKFPIARNMKEAKENFLVACNTVAMKCDISQEPFILLMSLIFYGSKDEILSEKEKNVQTDRDLRSSMIINWHIVKGN